MPIEPFGELLPADEEPEDDALALEELSDAAADLPVEQEASEHLVHTWFPNVDQVLQGQHPSPLSHEQGASRGMGQPGSREPLWGPGLLLW